MKRSIDYADYDIEYVDVLDENGAMTGTTAEKFHVHEAGLWHKAVHVWIVNAEGKILLQKRSIRMDLFPGAWDLSVGAHLSAGETPIETAMRETKEELGLDVAESEFEYLFLEKNSDDGLLHGLFNHEFNDVYLLHLPEGMVPAASDAREVDAVKFFSIDEFESMIDMDRNYFAPPRAECRKILALLKSKS